MRKLIYQRQSKVFEKLVRMLDGRLFCVRFIVVERDGVLRGRVVSCIPILEVSVVKGQRSKVKGHPFCLPGAMNPAKTLDARFQSRRINSPYFNKFDFLTVIKIRAPSRDNA